LFGLYSIKRYGKTEETGLFSNNNNKIIKNIEALPAYPPEEPGDIYLYKSKSSRGAHTKESQKEAFKYIYFEQRIEYYLGV